MDGHAYFHPTTLRHLVERQIVEQRVPTGMGRAFSTMDSNIDAVIRRSFEAAMRRMELIPD